MNWHDVVPDRIAINQIAWDRRQTVVRMREAGLHHIEIGTRLAIPATRISDLYRKGMLERDRPSPVMEWLNDEGWLFDFWLDVKKRTRRKEKRKRQEANSQAAIERQKKYAAYILARRRKSVKDLEETLIFAREQLALAEQAYALGLVFSSTT